LFLPEDCIKEAKVQLTRQQQRFLASVLLLLLTGLAVKTWRAANPAQGITDLPERIH